MDPTHSLAHKVAQLRRELAAREEELAAKDEALVEKDATLTKVRTRYLNALTHLEWMNGELQSWTAVTTKQLDEVRNNLAQETVRMTCLAAWERKERDQL